MRASEAAFASDDTEITLGAGKLLGLFFLLAMVCGVFFSIGYSLGKSSGREQAMNDQAAASTSSSSASSADAAIKPSAGVAKSDMSQEDATKAHSESELGFYKAVQKNEPDTQLKSDGTASATSTSKPTPSGVKSAAVPAPAITETSAKPGKTQLAANNATTPVSARPGTASGNFVVQIAAVSHEEDAVALAGALRKKNYSVFVVNYPAVSDKLYHVQVGPFASLQEAEAMKDKLTSDGYNPIVKR